ncbi:MAG: hypothetical protein ABIO58_05410 [Luteimonas sp.]
MNALPRFAILSLSVLGLAACASMQDKTAMAPAMTAGQHATIQTDYAYMAKVESIARARGVDVQWVNPPVKRSVPHQQ